MQRMRPPRHASSLVSLKRNSSSLASVFAAFFSRRLCSFASSGTLSNLLAEHLVVERRSLEGRFADLREARQIGARGETERRFADTQKLLGVLNDFIAKASASLPSDPCIFPPPTTKSRSFCRASYG